MNELNSSWISDNVKVLIKKSFKKRLLPFKRQPYKMVKSLKQTQLILGLSVFDHFVGLVFKGLKVLYLYLPLYQT